MTLNTRKSLINSARLGFTSLILTVLLGCGFALRGNVDIPESALSLDLVFNTKENLSLSRQFSLVAQQNGIDLTTTAQYQIAVSRVNFKRVSSTFDSNAVVDEYTLRAEVIFDIHDGSEEPIAQKLEAFSQRTFQFDANAAASSNSRESIVSAELWRDISQQMLRQYAARLKK